MTQNSKINKKYLIQTLKIIVIGFILSVGFSYAQAQWIGAPGNPPDNNVPTLLNVGSDSQVKTDSQGIGGGLVLGGLGVFGNTSLLGNLVVSPSSTSNNPTLKVDSLNNKVGIGIDTPAEALDVGGPIKASSLTSSEIKYLCVKQDGTLVACPTGPAASGSFTRTASGIFNFTVPNETPDITTIDVQAWGGGGGGGGGGKLTATDIYPAGGGGGGGAGGYVSVTDMPVFEGQKFMITVGAGGSLGFSMVDATAGGDTIFRSGSGSTTFLTAQGGAAGVSGGSSRIGGAGGSGSGGTVNTTNLSGVPYYIDSGDSGEDGGLQYVNGSYVGTPGAGGSGGGGGVGAGGSGGAGGFFHTVTGYYGGGTVFDNGENGNSGSDGKIIISW